MIKERVVGKLKDKRFEVLSFNIQRWIDRIKEYLNQFVYNE